VLLLGAADTAAQGTHAGVLQLCAAGQKCQLQKDAEDATVQRTVNFLRSPGPWFGCCIFCGLLRCTGLLLLLLADLVEELTSVCTARLLTDASIQQCEVHALVGQHRYRLVGIAMLEAAAVAAAS
jgi:hypothetical protein